MATDGDEPQEASEAVSNADSIASSSDSDSDSGDVSETPVEWLATGRSKRSTAGNRMKSMLATETPADEDSDLELLFQEDADDVGFTDKEDDDGSDAAMESSDDEDENEAQDDDAGEKELERQAREKKAAARKRKAQEAIPAKFRKKVRINHPPETSTAAAAAAAPPPRPKKKSERASWLPTEAEMPTRASGRKTTQLSKEQLHQQMIEREARRLKQVEAMERKAKKKEAMKKPPMTQAERLKEATIIEKRNAKSLNRWEEAEKQREEERRAKLAALNNRRLEGPVVTFWTGIIDLSEVQLKHVGKMVSMEEKPKRKRPSTIAGKVVAPVASLKTESGASETAQTTPTTQDAPGLPARPDTPRDLEAPKVDIAPAPVTIKDTASTTPLSSMPASSVPTSSADAPLIPVTEASTQPPLPSQPTPPPTSLTVSPAAMAGQNTSTLPTAPAHLTTTAASSDATPLPVAPPSTVKIESQSSKPIPLALRPDIGPRFMPPPNPHFAQPAQISPLAAPVGIPNAPNGQMPALGGYAATPVPRASSLSAPVAASPRPFSPLNPSSLQTPSMSPPPLNSNPLAAFPNSHHLLAKQSSPSPVHTTASFEPIAATAPPSKATKKQQADPAATKKSASKAPAARKPPPPPEPPAPEPPMEGKVTRACIILQDFDEDAIKKPDVQTQILFGWKMNKLASMYAMQTPSLEWWLTNMAQNRLNLRSA